MLKHIITPLMICCLSTHVFAEEVVLNKNHPDTYVVQKGDTLWGISGKFLQNPWQWPKVWKMNRAQIKNPHRIYPGDVVAIDMSGGDPQLRLLRETVNLEPGSRVEGIDKEAIRTIPANIISPFLSQPLVIETAELDKARTILESRGARVALSTGMKIYTDKISEGDGLHWYIYRNGKELIDPDTKENLGTEAVFLGTAKVLKYGEPATAEIVTAKEEILKGEKIIAAVDNVEQSYVPRAPETEISGRVLGIYGGVAEAAAGSILTLNKGKREGLEEGHVLAIYREGAVVKNPKYVANDKERAEKKLPELNLDVSRGPDGKLIINKPKEDSVKEAETIANDPSKLRLPNERVGLVMVFKVFEKVSYGLVVQSEEPINVSDLVHTP
jgi:LysM domain